jgi:hypothetical protein
MITISDNDLKALLQYVDATGSVVTEASKTDLRMYNRLRIARNTVRKMMKRDDVQRVAGTLSLTGNNAKTERQ